MSVFNNIFHQNLPKLYVRGKGDEGTIDIDGALFSFSLQVGLDQLH